MTGPGEWVLEDLLLVDAEQRLADEGIGGDICLFKNSTDSAGAPTAATKTTTIVRAVILGSPTCCCPSWSPAS